jgi:hypothetical protein
MWRYCRGRPQMVSIAEAERIMSERRGEGRIRAGETRKGCTGSEDLVHENSILLLKVLNLEKNSNICHLSNHFDVVSCPRPVEFLEDICRQLSSTCPESLIDLTISPEKMETYVPEVVLNFQLALVPPSDDIATRWAICNELIQDLFTYSSDLPEGHNHWKPLLSDLLAKLHTVPIAPLQPDPTHLNMTSPMISTESAQYPHGIAQSLWSLEQSIYSTLCTLHPMPCLPAFGRLPDLEAVLQESSLLLAPGPFRFLWSVLTPCSDTA